MKQRWQVAKKHLQDWCRKEETENPYYKAKCSKFSHCSPEKKKKNLGYRFKPGNHFLEMTPQRWVYFLHCSTFFCMFWGRTRWLTRTVGSFVVYGCRKKSAGTVTWMSSDLVLIPFRAAVDLECSVNVTCLTCPDYSTHIWEITFIVVVQQPLPWLPGRSTQDNALPTSLPLCQANVFAEKRQKREIRWRLRQERGEEGGKGEWWNSECRNAVAALRD